MYFCNFLVVSDELYFLCISIRKQYPIPVYKETLFVFSIKSVLVPKRDHVKICSFKNKTLSLLKNETLLLSKSDTLFLFKNSITVWVLRWRHPARKSFRSNPSLSNCESVPRQDMCSLPSVPDPFEHVPSPPWYQMGMKQHLKMLNKRSLEEHARHLRSLRIESMTAYRPEDVVEILSAIPDKAEFNSQLRHLLFDTLIPNWNNLDAREQTYLMHSIIIIFSLC